jgi:hypothetical protein
MKLKKVYQDKVSSISTNPLACVAGVYLRKNAQVVTNLQQTCSNAVPTTSQQDVFVLLVPSLLTTCYKVVKLDRLVTSFPTTCYRPAIQQFVNKLRVTSLYSNLITASLQLVDKLATSMLRTHLVDKL